MIIQINLLYLRKSFVISKYLGKWAILFYEIGISGLPQIYVNAARTGFLISKVYKHLPILSTFLTFEALNL